MTRDHAETRETPGDELRRGPAAFERLAEVYDTLTDAPRRAEREAALLDGLMSHREVSDVHDAACGPGHHLASMAALGYEISGSDGSPAMVGRARALLAEQGATIDILDIAHPPRGLRAMHDAVICIGNSLPCVGGLPSVRRALRTLLRLTRPGGTILVHTQNLSTLAPGEIRSGPVRSGEIDGREIVLLRHYRSGRANVQMDVLVLEKNAGEWRESIVPVRLSIIPPDWLRENLAAEGASQVRLLGGLDGSPFDARESRDVFALARRRRV